MRLALTAISINGKSFPIQTSSIFVKRGAHGNNNPTVIGGAQSGAPMSLASIGPALSSSRKGALIGASSRTVAEPGPVYAENWDVSVTPERRLTFRLAQPLPLEF